MDYWIATLLGLGRLALVITVLYGLACWIFPLRTTAWRSSRRCERLTARALLVGALCTLLVLALVLLRAYDGLMLVLILAIATTIVLWWRYRGDLVTNLYVRLLELADQPFRTRSVLSAPRRRSSAHSTLLGSLLGGIALASISLRLVPILNSPAPFSTTHYRLLEVSKFLQANQLFPGRLIEARGFHGLTIALHSLAEVDMGIVVRLLGVLAVLFIMIGVYAVTRGYSDDSTAALGAAGLFGLGLPLLPLAIENQVEPTTTLLATAYALPTWYFLLRYQTDGHRSHLWVGGLGLVLVFITNSSVSALTLGILACLGLIQSVLARTAARTRRALLVSGMSLGGGLLLGALAALKLNLEIDPYAVPLFSVSIGDVSIHAPDLSVPLYGLIVGITAVALSAIALTDRRPFYRYMNWGLALTCTLLYGIWVYLEALPFITLNPAAPVALLSTFLAVAFGGIFAYGAALVNGLVRLMDRTPILRSLYYGTVPGALLAGLFLSPTPTLPTLGSAIEPPGYVRAIHEIHREVNPYQWTVVSHYGTAVHTMNRGRFLGYEYFLRHYDPKTYDHDAPEAIPTNNLFLFVPTDSTKNFVREELLATSRNIAGPMQHWCNKYVERSDRLSLFYADEHLNVYRLTRTSRADHKIEALLFRPSQ